ncbi:MAG: helix-turn-helix domain-containing protein [Nanoarchaeota archaeon]|nr:helix-turn-helix domain-containing protein [Nanoarchaeota archaeon]
MEHILKTLKSLGLTENEVKIYIDLLKNSTSSASEISNRTKIHRSNIYDTLKSLIEKSFVLEIIEEKRKLFNPISPERIKDYLMQKEQEIESILPDLKNLTNLSEEKESVTITKGIFAMRNSFYDLLDIGKPINAYGISRNASEFAGFGFLDDFHKKRIKKKIPMKHIYNQEAKDRMRLLNKLKYTEARHLEGKYDAEAPTNICDDTVIFFVFSDPVSVIKIKSKKIADTYNRYFEILWNNSKK